MEVLKYKLRDSNYTRWLIKFFGLCLAILIPLTACSEMKIIKWREEVKLANGQIIIVEREQEYRNIYAGGGGNGWLLQDVNIKMILPILNKKIVWKGTGVTPLAINTINNNDIYIVIVDNAFQGGSKYPLSHGDHVALKYSGNGPWVQIPVESVPREIHQNLLVDAETLFIDNKRTTKELVNLALKEKVDSDPRIGQIYKSWPVK